MRPYPARLQALLPKTEVINLGVHGYGHDQMLIRFNEEGVKYHPTSSCWLHRRRHAAQSAGFRDHAKPRYELGRDAQADQPAGAASESVPGLSPSERFPGFAGAACHRWSSHQEQTERITTAILDELAAAVSGRGLLVLVQLPTGRIFGPFRRGTLSSRAIAAFVTCLTSLVRPSRPAAGFKKEGHWDPAGHRMMAEGIRDASARQLLP